jgi:hypothetical protein
MTIISYDPRASALLFDPNDELAEVLAGLEVFNRLAPVGEVIDAINHRLQPVQLRGTLNQICWIPVLDHEAVYSQLSNNQFVDPSTSDDQPSNRKGSYCHRPHGGCADRQGGQREPPPC